MRNFYSPASRKLTLSADCYIVCFDKTVNFELYIIVSCLLYMPNLSSRFFFRPKFYMNRIIMYTDHTFHFHTGMLKTTR